MMVDQPSAAPGASGPRFATACAAVLATRLAVAAVLAGLELLQPTVLPDARYTHGVPPVTSLGGQLLVKWDSYWYLQIAEHGYRQADGPPAQSARAFAPLYPAIIAGLSGLGLPAWVGGAVWSLGCFGVLLWALYQWGSAVHSRWLGAALMAFVSAFPSGWVLHMVYAEAMFCACLVGFLWLYQRQSFWAAGICALVLPQVRLVGLAIWPALCLDFALDCRRRRSLGPAWRSVLLSTVGVVLLGVISKVGAGGWGAMMSAGRSWYPAAGVTDSWFPLIRTIRLTAVESPVALLAAALLAVYGIAGILLVIRRRNIGGWFALVYLLILLRTPFISAQFRYLLPLIPVHAFLLEHLRGRCRFKPLIGGLLIVQIILTRWELQWLLVP